MTPRALNVAVATADPGLQVQAEAAVEILGLPAFRLEVDDVEDPVEVGGRTSYRIVVTNQGSLPGNQVEIAAVLPPQMKLVNATGPSQYRQEGQRLIFAAVDSLPPGQQLNYNVTVEALQVGDVRFRTELRSATLKDPVIEEESTTIWNPPPANPTPAKPPSTGSGTTTPPPPAPTGAPPSATPQPGSTGPSTPQPSASGAALAPPR
jgi:uncharacterized repeat protein (TIGR01451 family)